MALTRSVTGLVCFAVAGALVLTGGPAAAEEVAPSVAAETAAPSDPEPDPEPDQPTPKPEPEPVSTTTTLTGPAAGYVGHAADMTMALTDESGAPVEGALVAVERRVDGTWRSIGEVTTDVSGGAVREVLVRSDADDNAFRAVYAGDDQHAASVSSVHQIAPVKYASRITVRGPATVVDERAVTLRITWQATAAGETRPVNRSVRVFRKQHGTWRRVATVKLGADGAARLRVRPRHDTRWKAIGSAGRWFRGDVSNVHVLDNVPPGLVIRLPKGTPKPTVDVPPQRRALGAGPNVRLTRIPDAVWRDMVGVSWTPRCPVGREGLRLIRVNYWGYDGYRRRGEMVSNARVASRVAAALAELYRNRVPIRSMYRVDRFGYNSKLRGGDDYKSMAAGNTSGYNCRGVANNPSRLSPHSSGASVDINTWENPYASRYPNSYWRYNRLSGAARVVTWRSADDLVPRIFRRHGIRWTYGLDDIHHFDA